MPDQPTSSTAWTDSSDAVTLAAAVAVANDAGVLAAIESEHEPAAIARAAGCDPRGVELVLDVLADAGVLVRRCGGYWFPDGALGASELAARFDAIEQLVRTGRPATCVDATDGAEQAYPGVVARLGGLVEVLARELAANHVVGGDRPLRMLDVAAGAAPFAIAFAAAGARATAVDLPSVVPVTDAAVAAAGVTDSVTVIAGDLFGVELTERFDVVVLAGFCRLVGPDRAATAIARCAGWLAPGGTLLVVDAVDTLDTRRRGLARYALGLATRTATGRPHSYPAYGGWLAAAGLEGISLTTTDRPELSVISARLPEGA